MPIIFVLLVVALIVSVAQALRKKDNKSNIYEVTAERSIREQNIIEAKASIEQFATSLNKSLTFEIAGIAYDGSIEYINQHCYPYSWLQLIPEPQNPHDSHSIGVYHKTRRIGYVPSVKLGKVRNVIRGKHVAYIKQFRTKESTNGKVFFDVDVAVNYIE